MENTPPPPSATTRQKSPVLIGLKGQFNGYCNEIDVSALWVPEICTPLPVSIDPEKYNYLQGYQLMDQYTHTTNFTQRPINLLIGSDQYYDIVTGDTDKSMTQKGPVAVSSIFGYLICGPTTDSPDDEIQVNSCLIVQGQYDPFIIEQHDKLENTLKRFWESKGTGANSRSFIDKRIEDENTDKHENFLKDICFVGNQYHVKLPWIDAESMPSLTGNYDLCKRRLNSFMFRLKKDPKLSEQYDDIFQEQLSSGVIERVKQSEYERSEAYFLPHQPVIKIDRDTTKCRVVFDASAKDKEKQFCLNDYLEEGQISYRTFFMSLSILEVNL